MVVEAQRASTVDMSEVGVSVSRLLTKIGCVPSVSSNICATVLGLIDQPSSGVWQVPQCRPLVPCGVKNSLSRSTKPALLNDAL